MISLPLPSKDALAHSQQLQQFIANAIQAQGGWIDFAQFMHMALYTPQLGYYSGGAKKFGLGGDFVTAPEISPLFGQCLASQIAQVLTQTSGDVLELGAGTGRLAVTVLLELAALDTLPAHYYILEVSDYLREIQCEICTNALPEALLDKVVWLYSLPANGFKGCIIANEVLDAIPIHLLGHNEQGLFERGVCLQQDALAWQDQPLRKGLLFDKAQKLNLPTPYLTEINLQAHGLIASLAQCLQRGVMLLIDYGFSAREYYHAQRHQGTLMCHYQQRAHDNPLLYVGLQDITAHVDFTAIAQTAVDNHLQLAGYTSQAQFLINCGITELLQMFSPHNIAQYAPAVAAAQKLLSPAEMGELFKVIGFSKGVDESLMGFLQGDKAHTL